MSNFEPRTFEDIPVNERPTLFEALAPIIAMLLFLFIGIIVFDLGALIPLVWGIAFTGLFTRYHLGYSWDELYDGISNSVLMGLQVVFIMFIIYAVIASFILAGTIPGLMYYGLDVLFPAVFLPLAAIISAIVAIAIGSSVTTAGTLGVAFLGIGSALGFPEAITAGAVLSGAYTGDKQSPLSETTNLAAAVTNTNLYDHINGMRVGTLMAFGISIILYIFLGLNVSGDVPVGQVDMIQTALTNSYSVTPLVFLPLLVTLGLAIYGIPALPTLSAGVFTAILTAIFVQGIGFTAAWSAVTSGTEPDTGMKLVNELLQSSGIPGAVGIVTIVLAALSLGGIFERTNIFAVLAHHLGRLSQGTGSLTLITAVSAIMMNILSASQYMSVVVPGMTFRDLYNQKGLKSKNLSRAIEAAGTTTGALIPWNGTALLVAGALGVPTLQYAPYYFFGYLSPLILLVMGMTGWQIAFSTSKSSLEPGD